MWRKVLISLYLALDIENNKQEQSDTAYLNRGESGLNPDSGRDLDSGPELPPKFNGNFLVHKYICYKIFMKISSLSPEI